MSTPAGRCVLLVDDEPIVVSSAKRILERKGYRVLTAHTGRDALQVFRDNRQEVDIILLDLSMPDMHGEEILERILEIDRDAKAILFSGFARGTDTESLIKMGAVGHIQKPFEIRVLIDTIDKALG